MKIEFKDSIIRKLEIKDVQYRVWDSKLVGFGLIVYPSGRKVFTYNFRNKEGRTQTKTIGKHGTINAKDAREVANTFALKLVLGEEIQKRKDSNPSVSFKDLFSNYRKNHMEPGKGRKGIGERLREEVERFMSRLDDNERDFSKDNIIKIINDYADKYGDSQSNNLRGFLSKMFNVGIDKNLLEHNPITSIPKKDVKPRERVATKAELQAFRESVKKESIVIQVFVTLILNTACRSGELKKMKWNDIDENTWTKPTTKNGKAQKVHLNSACLEALNFLDRPGDYVFYGKDSSKPFNGWSKVLGRIRKRVGIEDLHFHDLRRTMATMLLENGTPVEKVSQLLNHSNVAITQKVYALWINKSEETTNRIGEILSEAGV